MFNIDPFEIEFNCLECGFYNEASIKEVRTRDVIICRGCKLNIQLEDYMNEVRKTERQFRNEMKKLNNTFKELENISIEL